MSWSYTVLIVVLAVLATALLLVRAARSRDVTSMKLTARAGRLLELSVELKRSEGESDSDSTDVEEKP
ncbi:hypothetical protein CLV40_107226 [Actinokineospora auranticolor]|uniref:Uncharacterized protein n=1 Tax=Actinokineospora auranticolor TaxID=155976 RepID=A0A2S6GQT5_9PSEU|nr:hypothetical protein CLV40_107226 [Actinokineospora auranticolor]